MNELFQLVDSTFAVEWDIEFLTKDFPIIKTGKDPVIISNVSAYWQYYNDTKVYFARNFHILYRQQTIDILKKLLILKENLKTLKHKSSMVQQFIDHQLSLDRLTIIRVDSTEAVSLHYDSTRNFAINIGLKNSSTCITNIYTGPIILDTPTSLKLTDDNVKHTYRMSDGDVYLVNTKQPHEVVPLVTDSGKSRYIASYSL